MSCLERNIKIAEDEEISEERFTILSAKKNLKLTLFIQKSRQRYYTCQHLCLAKLRVVRYGERRTYGFKWKSCLKDSFLEFFIVHGP